MARPPIDTSGAAVVLICLALATEVITISADGGGTIRILPPPHDGARPAMIIPLFPSPANAFGNSPDFLRRRLKGSDNDAPPNARMYLHDDLLLNGYYTTRLLIGTPPQKFALIVDTGSTVTYVPCSTCDQCGHHQDPKFQPDLSSTYEPVKCSPDCNCDDERRQCVYDRQYAEMSTSSGVLGEDLVSFGNLSELAPQLAVFGCENVETGDLYSQHADGIMGLGRGDLSIMDQLVEKGVISDSFSLCYGGMEIGGGAMVLGGISPPSNMVFAHSDAGRSPYYNIDLKEIHVGGKPLPVNSRVFDERYGTVLDSGTTYAYLPVAAFSSFKEAIMKGVQSLKQIRGPDPNYNDICFSGAGSDLSRLSSSFPTVDMVFGNGQKLALSPENYLFQHSKVRGAYCLGVFQNGRDPTTLLGGIVVRNTLVTYDRQNSKVGFWKTNCSDLWERLHLPSASPSAPSPSDGTKNQTKYVSPSPSPMTEENISIPAETQIGQITFEMSSGMNSSVLKSHLTELTESIAHELDLNVPQVHFVSLTSVGNGSVTKWAIRPVKLGQYISNATAMDIVARLSQHRLQLPDSFGSYKFAQWQIEPPVVRTWQKHYTILVLVAVVALIVTVSASAAWFLWRRRQRNLLAYKPVGATAPEQELQLQSL